MAVRKQALSPSRAKEYKQCPLKFRFSVVDRLPQPHTEATTKGTLVHAVLEELYLWEPSARTLSAAQAMLAPALEKMLTDDPTYLDVFTGNVTQEVMLQDAAVLLERYFQLEQPQNLAPVAREQLVDAQLPSGLNVRGIIDRIDQAPSGALRVIDYKTGKAPLPRYMDEALFQMRFYALLLRATSRLPARLQLLYLKTGDVLTLDPVESDIDAFEEQLNNLWRQISADLRTGEFKAKRGPLCNWCAFQKECPEFGGSPRRPEPSALERTLSMAQN